ncbi:hypothetical protein KIPB_008782, partial [Kipferlia bialata]|eukprot:g8782.t1
MGSILALFSYHAVLFRRRLYLPLCLIVCPILIPLFFQILTSTNIAVNTKPSPVDVPPLERMPLFTTDGAESASASSDSITIGRRPSASLLRCAFGKRTPERPPEQPTTRFRKRRKILRRDVGHYSLAVSPEPTRPTIPSAALESRGSDTTSPRMDSNLDRETERERNPSLDIEDQMTLGSLEQRHSRPGGARKRPAQDSSIPPMPGFGPYPKRAPPILAVQPRWQCDAVPLSPPPGKPTTSMPGPESPPGSLPPSKSLVPSVLPAPSFTCNGATASSLPTPCARATSPATAPWQYGEDTMRLPAPAAHANAPPPSQSMTPSPASPAVTICNSEASLDPTVGPVSAADSVDLLPAQPVSFGGDTPSAVQPFNPSPIHPLTVPSAPSAPTHHVPTVESASSPVSGAIDSASASGDTSISLPSASGRELLASFDRALRAATVQASNATVAPLPPVKTVSLLVNGHALMGLIHGIIGGMIQGREREGQTVDIVERDKVVGMLEEGGEMVVREEARDIPKVTEGVSMSETEAEAERERDVDGKREGEGDVSAVEDDIPLSPVVEREGERETEEGSEESASLPAPETECVSVSSASVTVEAVGEEGESDSKRVSEAEGESEREYVDPDALSEVDHTCQSPSFSPSPSHIDINLNEDSVDSDGVRVSMETERECVSEGGEGERGGEVESISEGAEGEREEAGESVIRVVDIGAKIAGVEQMVLAVRRGYVEEEGDEEEDSDVAMLPTDSIAPLEPDPLTHTVVYVDSGDDSSGAEREREGETEADAVSEGGGDVEIAASVSSTHIDWGVPYEEGETEAQAERERESGEAQEVDPRLPLIEPFPDSGSKDQLLYRVDTLLGRLSTLSPADQVEYRASFITEYLVHFTTGEPLLPVPTIATLTHTSAQEVEAVFVSSIFCLRGYPG